MAKTYRKPRTSDKRREDWRKLSTARLERREHEAEMEHALAWRSFFTPADFDRLMEGN